LFANELKIGYYIGFDWFNWRAKLTVLPSQPALCLVSILTTAPRTLSKTKSQKPVEQSYSKLDSHADTCTFRRGSYVLQDTGTTISVNPFDSSLGSINNVPIVTAALAYQDPTSLQTFILYFPQSLYIESLDTTFFALSNFVQMVLPSTKLRCNSFTQAIDLKKATPSFMMTAFTTYTFHWN